MRVVNVEKIIDESKFNRFHGLMLFWCTVAIAFDGYDLVIYGSVVPVLISEWSITASHAGLLQSYALLGMMFGALFFGPLADRIGRKNVILFCLIVYSLFTGLAGMANGPTDFGIYRFITGLGLGGVMPNAIALMSEFSPKSLRSTLVSIIFSGYCVGGIAVSGLAIIIIPELGWRPLFYIGMIPLLAVPFMIKTMPDSPRFMLKKESNNFGELLSKVNPNYIPANNDQFKLSIPNKEKGNSVIKLFKDGRASSTILLWIAFFMCLLMVYGLSTWLPELMVQAGYPLGSSILFLLVLNLGAIFGGIFGGRMADRWNAKKVLIILFIIAAASITLLAFKGNILFIYILVGIAGATTIGTQMIANAYVSDYYSSDVRSSGIGWALGIGRIGGMAGPLLGGTLLTMNLPLFQNFLTFAIPGLVAAICIWFVKEQNSYSYAKNITEKKVG